MGIKDGNKRWDTKWKKWYKWGCKKGYKIGCFNMSAIVRFLIN